MLQVPRTIREGDCVIVYEGIQCTSPVRVTRNSQFTNRYGTFRHNDMIGAPFGSKCYAKLPGQVTAAFGAPWVR